MKKYVLSVIIFIVIFVIVLFEINKSRDYSLEYNVDNYLVYEQFDKEFNVYYYSLSKDDIKYEYSYSQKYSKNRRIIKKIDSFDYEEYNCIDISFINHDNVKLCYKDGKYFNYNSFLSDNNDSYKLINNYYIYDTSFKYFVWNGYGLTDINNNKKYNVLKNENYSNTIYYNLNDKIVFADYDSSHTFNKFYVFDTNNLKFYEIEGKYNISFDSYFMGDYDDCIYLYDRKNKKQYKINMNKKSIKISSNNNSVFYYDKKVTETGINKPAYDDYLFNYINSVNYSLDNNLIINSYYKSDIYYNDVNTYVTDIINIDKDVVYYIKDDTVYMYSTDSGVKKLITYFDWKFNYKGILFIFNNK